VVELGLTDTSNGGGSVLFPIEKPYDEAGVGGKRIHVAARELKALSLSNGLVLASWFASVVCISRSSRVGSHSMLGPSRRTNDD
jgi:hypothetical protein